MPSHYTALEMFIFTDTKFKQEIEYAEYQYEATEKRLISMVVDGGRAVFAQPRNSNQWVRRGAQPWAGLDKGSIRVLRVLLK